MPQFVQSAAVHVLFGRCRYSRSQAYLGVVHLLCHVAPVGECQTWLAHLAAFYLSLATRHPNFLTHDDDSSFPDRVDPPRVRAPIRLALDSLTSLPKPGLPAPLSKYD